MIRIELGAQGLGRARFAICPLGAAADLLFAPGRAPQSLDARWGARATEVMSGRCLGLLAVVGSGGPLGYQPDFLRPEPLSFDAEPDIAFHQVATASAERIRYEMSGAIGGHSWDQSTARKPPRLLLTALDRGEGHFARRLADELEQFWRAALAPHWPGLRARLEADITVRAAAIARRGWADTINQLAGNLQWRDGGLDLRLPTPGPHQMTIDADSVIFIPSAFVNRAVFCAGAPDDAPDPRTPLVVYPALPLDVDRPRQVEQLIGETRTRVLAELAQPRTTGDLARRLHLSPATVSYHLQILHRAGLIRRTRSSRHVLYQRLPVTTLV
ncbi:ArsR/SmtB family transcription factor [Streptantibioticus rubrisoli]|uniref:Winged helix-turn-helix domain-containing protein n=1 Tax=Streptantibioticus rubrisoli TaxID=1387313 RepID=A0ABT1PHY3_9ACTN|nr:winged helix-turn-helix domain-containing protein [Streptantibioticus rubrisoli]MCQ4044981.1 winged helix-turn-helix domain-containing protein [Streptantibioticus rubrisoli]